MQNNVSSTWIRAMKEIKQDDDLKNNWEQTLEVGSLERVSEEVTHKLRLEG